MTSQRNLTGLNLGASRNLTGLSPNNITISADNPILANTVLNNTNITIEWYVAATATSAEYTSHFLEGKNLGAGAYITFSDIELVLSAGDKIQVTPDTAAHVDTILTVTETFSGV